MTTKYKVRGVVIIIGVLFISLIGYMLYAYQAIKKNINTLEGHWHFSLNHVESVKQPADYLEAFTFPITQKGDILTLERVLYEDTYESAEIAFDTWHTLAKVYLDEELIYTWGASYEAAGIMLGAARHTMILPKDYTNKTLKIELLTTEDSAMANMPSVGYYEASNAAGIWFNRPLLLWLAGNFYSIMGIVIICVAALLTSKAHYNIEEMMLGMCVLLTGIYILARGHFIQLLIPNPCVYNTIEFLSLYSIPIPIYMTFLKEARQSRYKGLCWFYYGGAGFAILFVSCATLLNFWTSIHFNQVVVAYYVIVLMTMLALIGVYRALEKGVSYHWKRIYFMGVITFVVGSIISIIAFKLYYYPFAAEKLYIWKWYNYILPLGMSVWVVFLLVAFYIKMKQILVNSYQADLLHFIAYYDPLTEIYNRRRFEETIVSLDNPMILAAYEIISMDLNGLKKTNDTLGHTAGDRMLCDFAKIINRLAEGRGDAYRLGGDEFAVVLPTQQGFSSEQWLIQLDDALQDYNQTSDTIQLSVACASASNKERKTALDVYKLADERMYAKKRLMHDQQRQEMHK